MQRPPRHNEDQYRAIKAKIDSRRVLDNNKIYDAKWRKVRKAHLQRHPLCAECERQGKITAAELVHHIVHVVDDPSRRLDPANLESLCWSCHSREHANDRHRNGGWSR